MEHPLQTCKQVGFVVDEQDALHRELDWRAAKTELWMRRRTHSSRSSLSFMIG
jgi:hypothetical protein